MGLLLAFAAVASGFRALGRMGPAGSSRAAAVRMMPIGVPKVRLCASRRPLRWPSAAHRTAAALTPPFAILSGGIPPTGRSAG
jgi:hypothetical protein